MKDGGDVTNSEGRGFWTWSTIARRNEAHFAETGKYIIEGFEKDQEKRRERASYNLTVGAEIYISPASEEDPKSRERLRPRESRAIPSGQFAFLQTAEWVSIPEDAIAFIALRSKATKFRGLVNVSGFYVEPGYSGYLIFAVFNAGPGTIHVARGDEWFEIFFADLDGQSQGKREKQGFTGISTDLITPLARQFHSLPGLDKKIDETKSALDERLQKVERDHSILRWSMALIIGAFIALGVRTCTDSGHARTIPQAEALK